MESWKILVAIGFLVACPFAFLLVMGPNEVVRFAA